MRPPVPSRRVTRSRKASPLMSIASTYPSILASAALIGIGSAVFHPEASRIAHMAAGRRRGFAQSLFQVGGNAGSSIGPLLAALIPACNGAAPTAGAATAIVGSPTPPQKPPDGITMVSTLGICAISSTG